MRAFLVKPSSADVDSSDGGKFLFHFCNVLRLGPPPPLDLSRCPPGHLASYFSGLIKKDPFFLSRSSDHRFHFSSTNFFNTIVFLFFAADFLFNHTYMQYSDFACLTPWRP